MSTSSFHLRNVAPEMMSHLKREAVKQKISVNSLILQIIASGIGVERPKKKVVYHDLDRLAGTWTMKDKKAFDENTKVFEEIDKEMWR